MLLHNKLQKDYTLNQSGYQLKLPLKLETIIPKNDSVRLLSQFVEEMDLTDLYSTYDRINSLSPRTLLKIVLYSYMNGDYSFRSMELNCKRDINFMFLLEGHSAPDHATLARFRSIHFAPCSKRILAEVSNILFDLGEISGETIFIDGTKIEANANKYTFVWKKAVTKNQAKLLIKLADFVAECEQLYDIKIVYGNVVKIKHLKRLRKKLYALKNAENITFVHGTGKRKTPLQKSIETLEEALLPIHHQGHEYQCHILKRLYNLFRSRPKQPFYQQGHLAIR
jgi:transposase